MPNRISKLFVFFFVFLIAAPAVAESKFPERIVSLKPNITEILFAIGAGDKIVGATTWCNRPEEAKKIPRVADYINPNVEKIVALKPDLVISSEENSLKRPVELLQKFGIPVLLLPFKSASDVADSILTIAEKTGHGPEGKLLAENIRGELEVKKTDPGKTAKTGLILVGRRPLVAAGRSTFLSEMIELAGGKNIVEGKALYPHLNMETIIVKDPDFIIDLSMGSETVAINSPSIKSAGSYWAEYKNLKAVRNNDIYNLDISDFRAGPKIVEQIKTLRKIIEK